MYTVCISYVYHMYIGDAYAVCIQYVYRMYIIRISVMQCVRPHMKIAFKDTAQLNHLFDICERSSPHTNHTKPDLGEVQWWDGARGNTVDYLREALGMESCVCVDGFSVVEQLALGLQRDCQTCWPAVQDPL